MRIMNRDTTNTNSTHTSLDKNVAKETLWSYGPDKVGPVGQNEVIEEQLWEQKHAMRLSNILIPIQGLIDYGRRNPVDAYRIDNDVKMDILMMWHTAYLLGIGCGLYAAATHLMK